MRSTEQLGRYHLLDLVAADPSPHGEVLLWHAYDEVLDRPVAHVHQWRPEADDTASTTDTSTTDTSGAPGAGQP